MSCRLVPALLLLALCWHPNTPARAGAGAAASAAAALM
jgi:hypothetical protein